MTAATVAAMANPTAIRIRAVFFMVKLPESVYAPFSNRGFSISSKTSSKGTGLENRYPWPY
jgi:hypothetical protein